jgi:hypothetical protein
MAIVGCDGTYSATGTSPGAGVEGIMVTLGPIDVPRDATRALVTFIAHGFTGAGTTAAAAQIRRGATITDPLITLGQSVLVTASQGANLVIAALDLLINAATVTYSGTVTPTAGNWTNKNAMLYVLFV